MSVKEQSNLKKKITMEEIIVSALALTLLKNLGESEFKKMLEGAPLEDKDLENILKLNGEIKEGILERYQE